MPERPRLSLSSENRLAMTFAMQQALAILQMPQIELSLFVQKEIETNPLLEEISPPAKKYAASQDIPAQESLHELLLQQMREHFPGEEKFLIAEKIFSFLDEKGFLSVSLADIAEATQLSVIALESVLHVLQTFDPPGIFARNLQESLLIQLRAKNMQDTYVLVRDSFDDLIHGRYGAIKKKCSAIDLKKAIQQLAMLSLRPTSLFKKEIAPVATADLTICQTETGWTIDINEEEIPQFQMQHIQITAVSKEEAETFRTWLTSGKWLQRSMTRRRQILLQIGMYITRHQAAFLAQKGNLKELTAQQLAADLGLHESTLSRALAGKYAKTPLGLVPLHALLTASPETDETKVLLRKLIEQENKTKPLTDEELSAELQKMGHAAARRTIAKYRKALKIGSAAARRYF